MKMTRLIQIVVAAFMAVALGCTTRDTNKYVGTWGGRSTKAKDGVMIKLEEGGGGYASTYVGAVPLKWRVTNVNHLDVRFGCGDGFLSFYDMVYLPDEKALRLIRQKSIHMMDGKTSKEHSFQDFILLSSNEYSKAMEPMIEYTKKAMELHAKSDERRHRKPPELMTNLMSSVTWDDVVRLDKALLGGWSVGISAAGSSAPAITIHSRHTNDINGFSIHGGKFVIGNPDDTCDFERPSQHSVFQPGKSVPQNATPLGTIWDAEADVDTFRRIQGKGWRVDRMVYYEGHFFYGIFHTSYSVQTDDMPADKLLDTIRECFGDVLKPPLDVALWKPKPNDGSTPESAKNAP